MFKGDIEYLRQPEEVYHLGPVLILGLVHTRFPERFATDEQNGHDQKH